MTECLNNGFTSVPKEILSIIFQYVPTRDLFRFRVADPASFARGLTYLSKLDLPSVSFDLIKWILQRTVNILALDLSKAGLFNFQLNEILHQPHLSQLHSLGLAALDLSLIDFEEFCVHFSRLQSLDLTAVRYLPEFKLSCLTRVTALRQLTVGPAVQSLVHLTGLTQLTALKVPCHAKFDWSDSSLWACFPNLEVLDLSGTVTTSRATYEPPYYNLTRVSYDFPFHQLTRVTQLVLNNCDFQEHALITKLTALPKLERLSMNGTQAYWDSNLRQLDYMSQCTALTELSLKDFRGYLTGLSRVTQLRALNVVEASICADELTNGLSCMTRLVTLHVTTGWRFPEDAAQAALMRMTRLRTLTLTNFRKTVDMLQALSYRLTNLRVLDIRHTFQLDPLALTHTLIKFPHLARVIMPQQVFSDTFF